MSEKDNNVEQVMRVIDRLQTGLVELFDQLRELRRLLNMHPELVPALSSATVPSTTHSTVSASSAVPAKGTPKIETGDSTVPVATRTADTTPSVRDSGRAGGSPAADAKAARTDTGVSRVSPAIDATVARLLDPIIHELKTGELTANIIAEHIAHAKSQLAKRENFERVEADIEVVLKYLRGRGTRDIRDQERENIIKRIERWKSYLSTTSGLRK